jgi:thiamine-monophosphate kinase
VGELDLIEYIRSLAASHAPEWLQLGIGDDAAVIALPAGDRIVLTTDMLVEGTHFEPPAPPEAVGRKAVARALSDVAALAARPLCVVAAVCFNEGWNRESQRTLCKALWEASMQFSAPLVGGDVSEGDGPLSLTVTALGLPGPKGVVTRAGAKPGDAVCVTGTLGGSQRGRHLSFTPRIAEAIELAERFDLHAMIDVSDGLSTDVLHVARASGCGIALDAEAIPVSEDALELSRTGEGHKDPLRHALNDGEDYELVFCLPERDAKEAAESGVVGTPVSIIGVVKPGKHSFIVRPGAAPEPLRGGGWEHLRG